MNANSQTGLDSATDAIEREKKFRKILEDIESRDTQRVKADWKDHSRDPSYSKFEIPYFLKCRERYNGIAKLYERQFQHEIHQLTLQQGTAYEALRLQRHLAISSLWPPLHTRRQLKDTQRYYFAVTTKQRERLNYLMNTKII